MHKKGLRPIEIKSNGNFFRGSKDGFETDFVDSLLLDQIYDAFGKNTKSSRSNQRFKKRYIKAKADAVATTTVTPAAAIPITTAATAAADNAAVAAANEAVNNRPHSNT